MTSRKKRKVESLFGPVLPKKKVTYNENITRFVISMNNDLGEMRRESLNYDYTHFEGVESKNAPPYISEKMKNRSNISIMTKNGKVGAWAAHISLLEKIVSDRVDNALILEDDCFQVRNFNVRELGEEPIYVNGLFHHPTNYSKRTADWVKKTHEELKPTTGINVLDRSKIRIVGMWGIFIPKWQQALEIAEKLKNQRKFTTVDSQISNLRLINRFFYPPLFRHDDFKQSNITKGGYGEAEYWSKRDVKTLMKSNN